MAFVRELLEDKPHTIGVRGTVVHVVKIPTDVLGDPIVYLYQVEVNGYVYQDIACTRDPELKDMKMGDEVLSHRPAPDMEGFPIFLLLTKAPYMKVGPDEMKEETEVGASDPLAMEEASSVTRPFNTLERDALREEAIVT